MAAAEREDKHAAPVPDPLQSGEIEGQNPNTPERLPGHTEYYTGAPSAQQHHHGGSVIAIAAVLCALAALAAMLAAA